MTKEIFVTKRDGTKEQLDINKIHKVIKWACEGLSGVNMSDVEMKSRIQFSDEMASSTIQQIMIKAAGDLISEKEPNYQYVASRLMLFDIRKKVYNQYEPWHLQRIIERNILAGVYDKDIINWYSIEEIDELNSTINHSLDLNLTYSGMQQLVSKYIVQDRSTNQLYESPQVIYMLVAMTTFQKYNSDIRLQYVKNLYKFLSEMEGSIPTPIFASVRTPIKQYASCVLISSGDSLNSICKASNSIVKFVSQKAGIGLNFGSIRAVGSKIGNGQATHTGLIPFLKLFEASVNSCSQGGLRAGSATAFCPWWHYEYPELVVLKNNKGTEETRVRGLDYGFQFNGFLYERYLQNKKVCLFSPQDVPGLLDAFYADQNKFKELYETYEQDKSIRRRVFSALEILNQYAGERFETSRLYLQNIDHSNTHSSFLEEIAPITQSNLCTEITIPTTPMESLKDEDGEIAQCILAAYNLGKLKKLSDLEGMANITVRMLDELIDIQEYPLIQAEISTRNRRSLGIGVVNLAYYLAKNDVKYSDGSAFELLHELFEAISFYSIKASMELAKEKGPCEWFNQTKYSKGILPIDTYKTSVDEIVSPELKLDWEGLRADILKYGMRNSTLLAMMPSESSSTVLNATNGVEIIRQLVISKGSKNTKFKQVVPDPIKLKHKYDYAWDMSSNTNYIKCMAIIQKFTDQTISVNNYYNPNHYPNNMVPLKVVIGDILNAYKYGLKTLYYSNVFDGRGEEAEVGCQGGACAI